jgi:phage I-like protein
MASSLSTAPIAMAHAVPAVDAPSGAGAEASGTPKSRIKLLPIGVINCRDGRVFYVDDLAHAETIVAASLARAGGTDIPIDFDHQLVTAPKNGGQAPASGWITALSAESDGIWANVTWTEDGFARLSARTYRYVSPAMRHDKAGRVLRIDHAGLVNEPAITELPAVASTDASSRAAASTTIEIETENNVDLTKIAAALGLPATATEDEILAAIGAMQPAMTAAATLTSAASVFGLPADADLATLATAAVAAAKPDPAKFAPIAVVDDLRGQLATLAAADHDRTIAAAKASGKLSPAMEPWARDYLAKDAPGFNSWLATAAVIVTPGEADLVTLASEANPHALTELELATCASLKLDPAAFAAAKKG